MQPPTLLRANPISISALPSHEGLPSAGENESSRPSLQGFLNTALSEAHTFITDTVPNSFSDVGKPRASPPANARVQLSARKIKYPHVAVASTEQQAGQGVDTNRNGGEEYWFTRHSVHVDEATPGTASWDEFVSDLHDDHLENEKMYVPSLTGVQRVVDWNCNEVQVDGWEQINAGVTLVTHTFQPKNVISPRIFPVVVVTATCSSSFIIIQIPLQRSALPTSALSSIPKRAVLARYTSVGFVQRQPESESGSTTPNSAPIHWWMSTTSDAGGWIPEPLQRSGTGSAIVKDVGLFMGYVNGKRGQT